MDGRLLEIYKIVLHRRCKAFGSRDRTGVLVDADLVWKSSTFAAPKSDANRLQGVNGVTPSRLIATNRHTSAPGKS